LIGIYDIEDMLVRFNKNVNSWKKVYNIPELVVRTVMPFNFGDLVSIFCLTIPASTKLSKKVCQQENCRGLLSKRSIILALVKLTPFTTYEFSSCFNDVKKIVFADALPPP